MKNLPSHCVCGSVFSTDCAMICSHGGLTITRHNDIHDITANWLSEVCRNVERDPPPHCLSQVKTSCHFLQTDMTMREQTFVQQASGDGSNVHFFDIRVFHPNAQSYYHSSISSLYRHHEQRRENMETLERLRTVPSLHLSLPQQEAWVGRLHYSTSISRTKYLKRGTPCTAKPWHGLGAPSPSPSYDPQ